jgi:hypothetical protein
MGRIGLGKYSILTGANDERVHHYQRGRASIMGLGLWSGKNIKTERLVVVVTARIVILFGHQSGEKMLRDTRPFSTRKMTEVQFLAF